VFAAAMSIVLLMLAIGVPTLANRLARPSTPDPPGCRCAHEDCPARIGAGAYGPWYVFLALPTVVVSARR
jgi:hypothetical protein